MTTHDIDNDEHFLNFDPFAATPALPVTTPPPDTPDHHPQAPRMPSHDGISTSEEFHPWASVLASEHKGKGVTKPVPIPAANTINDAFESSSSNPDFGTHFSLPESSPSTSSYHFNPMSVDSRDNVGMDLGASTTPSSPVAGPSSLVDSPMPVVSGKGKERAPPPSLPPLTFYSADFAAHQNPWMISSTPPTSPSPDAFSPGPQSPASFSSSSYSSSHHASPISPLTIPTRTSTTPATVAPPLLTRIPSRRRSLSNLSIRSNHSLAARSMSKIKIKLSPSSRLPSNLARALLFRKRRTDGSTSSPASPENSTSPTRVPTPSIFHESGVVDPSQSNCLLPWRVDSKVTVPLESYPDFDCKIDQTGPCFGAPSNVRLSKGKTRSNSAPLPFSALDIIPASTRDVFGPIPIIVRNYFDEYLPKELRLKVLHALIDVHQSDYERAITNGTWSMARASSMRGQWVGRDKGFRELVKFSRVSKLWQTLVFDGELWSEVDLRTFPSSIAPIIVRITTTGGSFMKSLNFSGHDVLSPETLLDITDNLCLTSSALAYTQLTYINLHGCTQLTTRALHHLLVRSRSLQKLSLKGLAAVTNNTCNILAAYCPQVTHLDLSRCPSLEADGISSLAQAALTRGEHMVLKELRISGLRYVDDKMMHSLGRACPYLETLDLSYSRQLHNSALEAFVACDVSDPDDDVLGVSTIIVSGKDIGQDAGMKYRRRVTRIRHLALSHCTVLTDIACSNLAFSVPDLEFLELAGVGKELRDEGLVRLLETTPKIRKLDLEEAENITDLVIRAVTPYVPTGDEADEDQDMEDGEDDEEDEDGDVIMNDSRRHNEDEGPQPGHALEHLIISFAGQVTDSAMLDLVRNCPRLVNLEADSTRITSPVLREFVSLARERKVMNAKLVAVDCRHINEGVVKELGPHIRPRKGRRIYEVRRMKYLDDRDGYDEDMKAGLGQSECDETRVVLKNFYSWQTVDAVKAAREKRRKNALGRERRFLNESVGSVTDLEEGAGGSSRRMRWWSPGGSRNGHGGGRGGVAGDGTARSPLLTPDLTNGDGCIIM
ncbi:RNI-like protein [Pluteus cervinus]|uniref:RNI-like protein n=1 Tax=Pluteus cervinus TaxID=181527 RepID=A0ACD3BHE2_9AGAR|nr:RNI-like protein [Pluteus cervinus]